MMVVEVNGNTVGECYREALFKIRTFGRDAETRGGRVLTIEQPVVLTLTNPRSRVLRDPIRNCNPFFHVMEVVWMMADRDDVAWISQFNKRMVEFSNDGRINGAYGKRWQNYDQIDAVIRKLMRDRGTRQAVLAMWDPSTDNGFGYNDYPCNTHIYFRVVQDRLNMTVCNRSNDLVWGMLGANVVHMTYLQEFIANALGMELGKYQVFTNNLHIYERHWHLLDSASSVSKWDEEAGLGPNILDGTNHEIFRDECFAFVSTHGQLRYDSIWLNQVAQPMKEAFLQKRPEDLQAVTDPAWRKAGQEWFSRRSGSTDSPPVYDDTTPSEY